MSKPVVSTNRKLMGIISLELKFETLTGLLIMMPIQAQTYRIGGADRYPMVTKRKYTIETNVVELEVPLVPGSSFKGRMRGLLESAFGLRLYSADKKIWQHVRSLSAMGNKDFIKDIEERCIVDELFGWSAANFEQIKRAVVEAKGVGEDVAEAEAMKYYSSLAPTRLLFSDFTPSQKYVVENEPSSIADFLEEKSENRIDRITAAADPRTIVRVKPGVEFEGEVKLLLFDNDKEHVRKYLETLGIGLKLIEETYLGGSGSRGYGRVRFTNIALKILKVNVSGEKAEIKEEEIETLISVKDFLEKVGEIASKIVEKVYS